MKVHIAQLEEIPTYALLRARAVSSREHVLVEDPAEADVIVLVGIISDRPHILFESPVYQQFPDKCTMYDESDRCVLLLPGVYCGAYRSQSSRIGRIFSFAYLSQNGPFPNLHVQHRPDAEKRYLFSFQGGSTSLVRKRLYRMRFIRPDVLVENTSSYGHWRATPAADQEERQRRYGEVISASHFVLCPRGAGSASVRFFEVMKAGVAPVLIADTYVLPPGVDWDRFLIRVKERDLGKLVGILAPLVGTAAERGRLAREAYLAHFAEDVQFDGVVGLCARSLRHGPPAETVFRARQGKTLAAERRRNRRSELVKKTVLTIMRVLRIPNPYQMDVK